MLNGPLENIAEEHLASLVENQVGERRDLEFKRDVPGGGDDEVREFLADVTSLANTAGGDLIFGIEEIDGVAGALKGVENADPDNLILRLENSLQSNVEPRLIGVRSHWVPLASGSGCLVLRIPASLAAPHRINFKKTRRFYGRNSRGKYEMDVDDLRHAFGHSSQLPKRFLEIHETAISAANGHDMPFSVSAGPTAVVSIAPIGLFREQRSLPVTRDNSVVPFRVSAYSAFDMIEGVLQHSPVDAVDGTVGSFALTHRTGRLDAAFTIGRVRKDNHDQDNPIVWPSMFEEGLWEMTKALQTRMQHHGVEGPWVILASVLGAKGFRLIMGDGYLSDAAFRDRVLLGQIVVERVDKTALLPIAQSFWLLFGQHRPQNLELAADRRS